MTVNKKFELRGMDRNYGHRRQRIRNIAKNMALFSEEFLDQIKGNIDKKLIAAIDPNIKSLDLSPLRAILNGGASLQALLNHD